MVFIFTITCSFRMFIEITYYSPELCWYQHFFAKISKSSEKMLKAKLHCSQQFLVCSWSVQKVLLANAKNIQSNNLLLLVLAFSVLCNLSIVCYIIWKYKKIAFGQQKVLTDVCVFVKKRKTLEQNNETTANFKATLVSYVFNITIEAKHSLRGSNYSNIISTQNSSSILSQFSPLTFCSIKFIGY